MMTMTFTEVSEVASEEPGGCPRTGGSPPERIPSSGGACSIGKRSVLRRQEERAPSRGEVLEVSSAAKVIEREALRIRLRSIIDEFEHKGTNKRAQSKEKIKLFIAFVEREHLRP
jgi:hypothetical protein